MKDFFILWSATGWLTQNRYQKIILKYKDLENAWKNISRDFLIKAGEREDFVDTFFEKKKNISLEKQKSFLEKYETNLLFFKEQGFPKTFLELPDCPIFIYVRGEILEEDFCSLSIVGSRLISGYGKIALKKIVGEIPKNITIISGLAFGVDALSHREALKNGNRTIGVLGTGIDIIYPSENRDIVENILKNKKGAIISEYPFGTSGTKYTFPLRNRLIAGFSLGTLIIEAKVKSGSLITANLAINYNKEVFAIPGNINAPFSEGTNILIKKGLAKLVNCGDDILCELNLEREKIKVQMKLFDFEDKNEEKIFGVLDENGKSVDEICLKSGLSQSEVLSKLTMLELKSLVENIGMGVWLKV